jgi:hypothetical protein
MFGFVSKRITSGFPSYARNSEAWISSRVQWLSAHPILQQLSAFKIPITV